jgi:hypothetical protein
MIKLIALIVLIFSFNNVFASPNNDHLKPSFRYAKNVDPVDFLKLDPRVIEMIGGVAKFCKEHNITFMITSAVRTPKKNKAVGAKSLTHVQGRAIDFSIKKFWGWTPRTIALLEKYIEKRYGEYGIIPPLQRQKVLLIHKVAGGAVHAHLQVTSSFNDSYTKIIEDIIP